MAAVSIRKTSSDPSAGGQSTPATPQSKKGDSPQGSHGARSIKEDSPNPKIPRDRTPTTVTRLSDRAIQQLKNAISASNRGDLKPLQNWCTRHAIISVNPKETLIERDLVTEGNDGKLSYKPLAERKIQKGDTGIDATVKMAIKAAKAIKPASHYKKSGGSAVKGAKAPLGKKRRKGNQPDDPVPDGDSAIVATPSESNPLMSVNRKDKEEGPEGVKVDKLPYTTQKNK